ncbi:hypothetical protein N9A63_02730 [Akkermansiaceae bacterium]|nr:hypothetical protein [Akkermansiaceae bacterium]
MESIRDIGSINMTSHLGFSGHPGLVSDIHEFRLDSPGTYDIIARFDDLRVCTEIKIVSQAELSGDPKPDIDGRTIGLDNESHGGLIIGDQVGLREFHEYFNNCVEEDEELWNSLADGVCDFKTQEFLMPSSRIQMTFAFVAAQGWFASVPLVSRGQICGYRIECNQTADGQQIPRPDSVEERLSAADINQTPTIYLNENGWAECPYCNLKFKPTDENAWTGFRHARCLSLLHIIDPPEAKS